MFFPNRETPPEQWNIELAWVALQGAGIRVMPHCLFLDTALGSQILAPKRFQGNFKTKKNTAPADSVLRPEEEQG